MQDTLFLLQFYFVATILLGVAAYLCWLEYNANNIALFFWATVIGIYIVPSMGDPFASAATVDGSPRIFNLVNNPVLLKGHWFALLFSLTYLAARKWTLSKRFLQPAVSITADLTSVKPSDHSMSALLTVTSTASVVAFAFGIYAIYKTSGLSGVMESGYSLYRLNSDPTFLRPAIFILAATSGTVYLAWRSRKWVHLLLTFGSVFGYFALSFSRQMMIFMAAPFALYVLYVYRGLLGRATTVLLAVLGYYLTVFLLLVRYYGSYANALEGMLSGDVFDDLVPKVASQGGELQLRYVYYFFLDHASLADKVVFGQNYIRLAMLPLPSEYSFGLKPEILDKTLFYTFFDDPIYNYVDGGTLHALIFGDSYANFGWFGIGVGAFWALVAHWGAVLVARCPLPVRIMTYATTGFGAVLIARGAVYNSCAYVFWSFIIIWIMFYISSAIRLKAPVQSPAHRRGNHGVGVQRAQS